MSETCMSALEAAHPTGCQWPTAPAPHQSNAAKIEWKTMRASNWLLPFRAVLPQSWRILPFWVPVCQTHRVLPQTLGETFWLGNPWSEAVICASLNPHGPSDTCSDCPNYTGAPVILNSPGHGKLTISCINSELYIGRYSIQHHSRSFWAILKWGITGITDIWCNIWQKATRIKQEPISQGLGVLPLKMSAFGGRVGWDGAGKNPCLLGPDHCSPLQKLKACQRQYYADTPCTWPSDAFGTISWPFLTLNHHHSWRPQHRSQRCSRSQEGRANRGSWQCVALHGPFATWSEWWRSVPKYCHLAVVDTGNHDTSWRWWRSCLFHPFSMFYQAESNPGSTKA